MTSVLDTFQPEHVCNICNWVCLYKDRLASYTIFHDTNHRLILHWSFCNHLPVIPGNSVTKYAGVQQVWEVAWECTALISNLNLFYSILCINNIYIYIYIYIHTRIYISLKLVDKFTYLGSSVLSTETDINTRLAKALTAIDRLSEVVDRNRMK